MDPSQLSLRGHVDSKHALAGMFVLGLMIGFAAGTVDTGRLLPEPPRNFETKGEPVLGNENATVTMVMFEDFQCPYCRKFTLGEFDAGGNPDDPSHKGAFQKIRENYVETGKVKIVWKDYPLMSIHPWALEAAKKMECVYRQDATIFWDLKMKIYREQQNLNRSNFDEKFSAYAKEEGLNVTEINSCAKTSSVKQEIREDMSEGGRLGTPTVFINGEKLSGAQPYARYKSIIESKLK